MANEADLTFLQKMIPHHQHGIETARVAARAGSTEVQEMATHVIEDQGQEVAEMEQLLADVGGAPGDAVPEPVKQRAMSQLVADLEAKPAMMFDRSFVATTIVHHMGAIDLAEMQLAAGEDDRVLAFSPVNATEAAPGAGAAHGDARSDPRRRHHRRDEAGRRLTPE